MLVVTLLLSCPSKAALIYKNFESIPLLRQMAFSFHRLYTKCAYSPVHGTNSTRFRPRVLIGLKASARNLISFRLLWIHNRKRIIQRSSLCLYWLVYLAHSSLPPRKHFPDYGPVCPQIEKVCSVGKTYWFLEHKHEKIHVKILFHWWHVLSKNKSLSPSSTESSIVDRMNQ